MKISRALMHDNVVTGANLDNLGDETGDSSMFYSSLH